MPVGSSLMSKSPTIVWFRKDLRLADNAALAAANALGAPVIPVFVWNPRESGDWAPGAASKWWLHQALKDLQERFDDLGGRFVLRAGDSLSELRDVVKKSGAERVFWNRRYEGVHRETDARIKRVLREDGLEVKSFNSGLLNEPHTVCTGSDRPYKVFTPYWKNVRDRKLDAPVEVRTGDLRFPDHYPQSVAIDSLELLPKVRWDKKLENYWSVGERAAMERLEAFLREGVESYDDRRDIPETDGTSRLSPYLHWGQIGPRQIMAKLRERHDLRAKGPHTFAQEIYWREFAYHVLYHFPQTPEQPLNDKYANFPWKNDKRVLRRWEKGRTGYPIVDAGMRQLYEMGWMHNRVRMIVSSLLVKHLLQSWVQGERWFWDTRVEADLASNTLGWQWS